MNLIVENKSKDTDKFKLNRSYVRLVVFMLDLLFVFIFGLLFGMVVIVEDVSSKVLFSFSGMQIALIIILNVVLWPILKPQKNGV